MVQRPKTPPKLQRFANVGGGCHILSASAEVEHDEIMKKATRQGSASNQNGKRWIEAGRMPRVTRDIQTRINKEEPLVVQRGEERSNQERHLARK